MPSTAQASQSSFTTTATGTSRAAVGRERAVGGIHAVLHGTRVPPHPRQDSRAPATLPPPGRDPRSRRSATRPAEASADPDRRRPVLVERVVVLEGALGDDAS